MTNKNDEKIYSQLEFQIEEYNSKIAELNHSLLHIILKSELSIKTKVKLLSDNNLLVCKPWLPDFMTRLPFNYDFLENQCNKYEIVYYEDYLNYITEEVLDDLDNNAIIEKLGVSFEELEDMVYEYMLENLSDRFKYDW